MLDVLRPVNREGSYQCETKSTPTTSEYSDSHFNTHSTVEDLLYFFLVEKMKYFFYRENEVE